MDMMVRTLRQQGFQPVSALEILEEKPSLAAREMSDVQARKVGVELQTNFVLYGSVSKIGEQISFDVRLVDVNNERPTASIYVTQEGLENLASAVSDLSGEVGIRILRRKKIRSVNVAGNERIETEAIKLNIKTKSGDLFDQAKLRQDLTEIYKMGYFKEVRIEAEDTPQGQDVVFVVAEKPTINEVTIRGAKVIAKEDVEAAMTTRQYSILQRTVLKEDVEKIRALYRDKGYYDAEVTYEVESLEGNRADVSFRIKEKKKLYVRRITFTGNQHFSDDELKDIIETSEKGKFFWLTESGILKREKLEVDSDRIGAFYLNQGFMDIKVGRPEATYDEEGIYINFPIDEGRRFRVGKVDVSGKDIEAAMATRQYSILQRTVLKEDVEKIRALYRDKGYYDAEVTYEVESLEGNRADVSFRIKEKKKLYVRRITFTGNQHFSDDELKDIIETSEKGKFFWLTESGILKREKLEVDSDRIGAFYLNQGFMDIKVGRPEAAYDEEGIYINFPIDEGRRFRVGKVDVSGKDIEPKINLLGVVELSEEKYFDREVLAKDLQNLTDFFTSRGYAFAEVAPKIERDEAQQVVNVDYEIKKGELVDFARINIIGNTKTRDKVIRRQLKVVEGARYSRADLERSVRNLQRLDFFETAELDTRKGKTADKMDVDVKVKEKATRYISAGAGYSSADEVFFQAQVAERNLFGRGQNLQFNAQLGTLANRFTLKFTEPWLFDIPLSWTMEGYNWSRDYDEYNKKSWGGRTAFSYPIWDYTRIYLSYIYDDAEISNVSSSAAEVIKDQEGKLVTSAISSTLRRDSRDHHFLTTRGSDNSLTVDYAGRFLGGDAGFIKGEFNSSWYFPLFWDCVGFLHGKTGYITENDGEVPIYERFYLGGINSIRAFGSGEVSPRDPETGDRIGGNKMVLFNAEFLFPLIKEQGVRGVLFFDAGNAYDNGETIDLSDLKYSIGGGMRWYSPMGPLRLEWGYNPDQEPGDPKSKWQFSMGVFF